MLPLLIPIGLTVAGGITKKIISEKVEEGIRCGIETAIREGSHFATNEAVKKIISFGSVQNSVSIR